MIGDCKLVVQVKEGKIAFKAEDASTVDLATIIGYLQNFVGVEALKRGMSLDDVKDNILDVTLAALQTIEEAANGMKEEMEHGN